MWRAGLFRKSLNDLSNCFTWMFLSDFFGASSILNIISWTNMEGKAQRIVWILGSGSARSRHHCTWKAEGKGEGWGAEDNADHLGLYWSVCLEDGVQLELELGSVFEESFVDGTKSCHLLYVWHVLRLGEGHLPFFNLEPTVSICYTPTHRLNMPELSSLLLSSGVLWLKNLSYIFDFLNQIWQSCSISFHFWCDVDCEANFPI